jgi:hypothetical protein
VKIKHNIALYCFSLVMQSAFPSGDKEKAAPCVRPFSKALE